MRRVDVAQKTPARRTYFEPLPLARIAICQDCTEGRCSDMLRAGRCVPTAAAIESGAVPAAASRAAAAADSRECAPAGPAAAGSDDPAAQAASSSRERVARFRAKHVRFDYVPSEDALRIFEHYRRQHPGMAASAVLDRLVLLAHRAIGVSGNGR